MLPFNPLNGNAILVQVGESGAFWDANVLWNSRTSMETRAEITRTKNKVWQSFHAHFDEQASQPHLDLNRAPMFCMGLNI